MQHKIASTNMYDKIKEKSIYAKIVENVVTRPEAEDFLVCEPPEVILQGTILTRYKEKQDVRSSSKDKKHLQQGEARNDQTTQERKVQTGFRQKKKE